ncbi:hypothetical protein FACS1894191_8630 [Clostridia bacterium]|nr:hypothetical protein FACS1894191_8630 [Clostridia bacterium]
MGGIDIYCRKLYNYLDINDKYVSGGEKIYTGLAAKRDEKNYLR